jgi:hypothetical protein
MLFAVLGGIFGQQQMVQINFLALVLVIAVSSVILVLPINRVMRWALFPDGTSNTLVSAHSTPGRPW